MAKNILKRSEVSEEFTWDLSDIFKSDGDWMKEYEELNKLSEKYEAFKGRLGESSETLLAFLKSEDETELRLSPLFTYANCKGDEDTANGFYQDLRGKAMSTYVSLAGASSFAASEIMSIPEETLSRFFREQPALETYRRPIEKIRSRAQHVLSPECEQLLANAGEMASAPDNIGSILRDADMRFPDVTDKEGNVHPLTDGNFVPYLESPDADFRKRVFDTYYTRMGEFKNTFASALDAQFRQLNFFAKSRRYSSTLEASLSATEVPAAVYHNLISAVHTNLDKMYRYVALRKKLLGVETLRMCDVYTPIVPDVAKEITYSQAKETVIEALSVMGEEYVSLLKKGFDERWIDVYENEGKRAGAYSSGSSRPHPYVLLNHKDNLNSMFTIAHEMGHALHSYYSTENQPVCNSDYVIFVAEVASTCNEVLLMRHLLSKTTDKKERAYLINHFLDQFKGTVYRQTMFAEFELEMGKTVESGASLTADVLCEKYLALNKLYFGEDMVCDEKISLEWTRIPHFFYNYYVFQYATGFSAAVAIASRILNEGEKAVADYKKFLSGGSSTDPISLLKIAGVDMSSPEPINSALALFDELITEMETLVL